jgi:hypothetical protein
MAAEAEKQIIKEPYNPTDPEVKFDPEFKTKVILKEFDDANKTSSNATYNSLKDDAINIPIVRLNNITLNDAQIDQVIIYYNSFFPTVHLSIKDTENVIKICDTPGFDNEINVVITCQINGYYKKISLLFYITDFNIYDEYIAYDGVFKLQSLNTHVMKQIGNGKLNTYNMLSEIAKENKLGFAATKKCEEINDEQYRLIRSKTYIDYIKEQLSFSGLDEESIFDAWIDIFGYIVMVNVYYVLNETIEPEQLTIYTIYGGENTINDENMDPQAIQVQRTLTNNLTDTTNTNLHFKVYENIIDNSKIYENGSLNTSWYMTSPCEENKLEQEQLQIIENSNEGVNFSKEYEFGKTQFLGIEFSETPILFKKKINQRYFEKLRAKKLKIELERYNLGLERGTLVNIIFKEYNSDVIKTFYNNNDIEESIEGEINLYMSGIYYIDSMEFEYVTEDHKIKQYLYLIKRSVDNKPLNKSENPILGEES